MKTLATINLDNVSEEEVEDFKKRISARAVVFNSENKIAFLRVNKDNYHKLPGGGVEEGEEITEALEREVEEEVGCDIKIGDEIGKVIEYRAKYNLHQESHVFFARMTGGECNPVFTEDEQEHGFELLWTNLEEAIQLLEADSPSDYEGKFIVKRDLIILNEAQILLEERDHAEGNLYSE